MSWLYFALNGVVLAAAGALGRRTRRLNPSGFFAAIATAATLMGLRIFLSAHPEHEQHLLRLSDDYIYFANWEAPLAVFMTLALAARLKTLHVQRTVVVALIVASPVFLWDSLAPCVQPQYTMSAQFDEDGVCRQSTAYSCGPAAGVTLLRLAGHEITEGEMARLCLLRRDKGVTPLELCRGLNVALRSQGRRATITRLLPEQLDAVRVPFLAEIRRSRSPEHCLLVLAVRPDRVLVADPAAGRYPFPRGDFAREWTGLAITLGPRHDHPDKTENPLALLRAPAASR